MPRSGSTLIQNLLCQNKKVYSTPTDGISGYFGSIITQFSNSPEFKAQEQTKVTIATKEFLKQGMEAYYSSMTDKEFIISKSRGWMNQFSLLEELYGEVKMICMVRDLTDVITSLEKKFRNTPMVDKAWMHNQRFANLTDRVNWYLSNPPLGYPLATMLEAIQTKNADKILFIRYEDLLTEPLSTLDDISSWLGIGKTKWNLKHIVQLTEENDLFHGIFGDHKIKNTLEPLKSDAEEILGKQLINEIKKKFAWFYEYHY